MSPEGKDKYSVIIEEKIRAGKARLRDLEHARNTSESAMTSRYDTQRESFAREANVQQELIDKMFSFQDHLNKWGPNHIITEGAEFVVEFMDDSIDKALFCPIMVGLDDVQIITPSSPIGKVIQGLKDGDNFNYKAGNETITGIVKNIK